MSLLSSQYEYSIFCWQVLPLFLMSSSAVGHPHLQGHQTSVIPNVFTQGIRAQDPWIALVFKREEIHLASTRCRLNPTRCSWRKFICHWAYSFVNVRTASRHGSDALRAHQGPEVTSRGIFVSHGCYDVALSRFTACSLDPEWGITLLSEIRFSKSRAMFEVLEPLVPF